MIRIAIVGDIGSGKTFISNLFNNFYEDEKILDISEESKLNNKLFILNLFIKTSHNVMFCLGMNPVEKM